METRRRYRKKPNQYVLAVRLDLDTDGFSYRKWGGEQHCKRGDWVVSNQGDTYTVDGGSFEQTYKEVNRGQYVKTTPIWAEKATEDGSVKTKEGKSHYRTGDHLVSNDKDGGDTYCISAEKFEAMYEVYE